MTSIFLRALGRSSTISRISITISDSLSFPVRACLEEGRPVAVAVALETVQKVGSITKGSWPVELLHTSSLAEQILIVSCADGLSLYRRQFAVGKPCATHRV